MDIPKEESDNLIKSVNNEKIAEEPKIRQIVIETDGNNINLIKAEVSGQIELIAILQNIIAYIKSQNNAKISPREDK